MKKYVLWIVCSLLLFVACNDRTPVVNTEAKPGEKKFISQPGNRIPLRLKTITVDPYDIDLYRLIFTNEEITNTELPIIITKTEAEEIAVTIEELHFDMPSTHDLLTETISKLGYQVLEVEIDNVTNGIFHAVIRCINDEGTVELTCSPTDAIAIAFRSGAPIYSNEDLIKTAGLRVFDKPLESE